MSDQVKEAQAELLEVPDLTSDCRDDRVINLL